MRLVMYEPRGRASDLILRASGAGALGLGQAMGGQVAGRQGPLVDGRELTARGQQVTRVLAGVYGPACATWCCAAWLTGCKSLVLSK